MSKCKQCKLEKADCECVCIICKQEEPNNISKARNQVSARKKKVVDWLECSVCKKWVHPICSGINKSNLKRIGKSFLYIYNYFI